MRDPVTASRLADLHRDRVTASAPDGWQLNTQAEDGQRWLLYGPRGRPARSLIWSIAVEEDDRPWWHVSMASASDRLPTWTELVAAKNWIIGPVGYAYQVMPPPDRYVNIHQTAMHFFALVGGQAALPEFSGLLPDGRPTL